MSPDHSPAKTRKPTPAPNFSLEDRLQCGAFTIEETCKLARISRPTLNRHRVEGLIKVVKRGGKVFVPGPELARYLNPTIEIDQ